MAEQSNMLFGMNPGTSGGRWNIVWDKVLSPQTGHVIYFWIVGPHRISRDLKFCVPTDSWAPKRKVCKSRSRDGPGWGHVTYFCTPYISQEWLELGVLRMQCVLCIGCSLCQITLASCYKIWLKLGKTTSKCVVRSSEGNRGPFTMEKDSPRYS